MAKIAFLVDVKDRDYMQNIVSEVENDGYDVMVYLYNGEDSFIKYLSRDEIDLLITFNCKGYEIPSLTGGVSLNFVNSKVLNVIYDKQFVECSCIKKNPISVSNFFYFEDAEVMEMYVQAYPHLPFVKLMKECGTEKKTNGTILYNSICEVLKTCYLS